MSNMYGALQQTKRHLRPVERTDAGRTAKIPEPAPQLAGEEERIESRQAERPSLPPVAVPLSGAVAPLSMEQEMIAMYQSMDSLLPETPRRVIQFIGSRSGEGVSTVVRQYAFMAAFRMGKPVLILDGDQNSGDQAGFFGILGSPGWDEALLDHGAIEGCINRVNDSSLFVSALSPRSSATPQVFDAAQLKSFFTVLKERFELVLIDSSSTATGADSTALSRCADGVVLVVEADKTRWPVAESLKARIQKSGGNILGVVLNKRRYYIPESIYRRL
jgi:protein-tyrosine kinase